MYCITSNLRTIISCGMTENTELFIIAQCQKDAFLRCTTFKPGKKNDEIVPR